MIWDDFFEKLQHGQQEGTLLSIVKEFLSSKIPESTILDYKWRIDLTQREHKEKLAKWIAGFANSNGGILVLGVKEIENTGEPDPDAELCPITIPDGIELIQHITNIVNGLINPRPEFHLFPINVDGGQVAIIIVPASANKPHVVQIRGDYLVPIRRGTSTVSATRLELDSLYADRLATKTTLEQNALYQFNRYCPEILANRPLCFIYATPVGMQHNLLNLNILRESEAYINHTQGVPGWGGGHRLPVSYRWRGCPEAGIYDYPENRKEFEYRAIAYRNGGIATWTSLEPYFWKKKDDIKCINPFFYFVALHGTLAPWLSFLSNFGIVAAIEGLVVLKNVTGCYPHLGDRFAPFNEDSEHLFIVDPPPFLFPFPVSTPIDRNQIKELCFSLFSEMFYSCGYTIDFSKRDNPNFFSSYLERQLRI